MRALGQLFAPAVRCAPHIAPRRLVTTTSKAPGPGNTGVPLHWYGASGLVAGGFGSLVGLGGGFVVIPILTRFCGFTQHQAHGTSLTVVAITGLVGCAAFGSADAVDLRAAAAMAATGMVFAPLGARFASRFDPNRLGMLMGGFMMLIAPTIPLKSKIFPTPAQRAERVSGLGGAEQMVLTPEGQSPQPPTRCSSQILSLLGIGGLTGFISGLFGIGGGSIMVPALALMTDMTHHTIIGTSLAAMIVPSVTGMLQHQALGNVVLRAAFPLSAGAAVGTYLGSKIGIALSQEHLQIVFFLFIGALGIRQFGTARSKALKAGLTGLPTKGTGRMPK